jgi:hypothetical protein
MMKFTLASVLVISPMILFAQENRVVDYFHDEHGNTYHQLYLDEQAKEVIDFKFLNSEGMAVHDVELSVDGYSVIIKNYPGNVSVILTIRLMNGELKEVVRSKCHIDPVILII